MPRFPALSSASNSLQPAVFTRLLPLMRSLPEPALPLHIGDTWLKPPAAAMLDRVASGRELYPYSSPAGDVGLRSSFCQRWTDLGLQGLDVDRVHVTPGATGAVQAAIRTFAGAGDDVMLLAPFWPLVRGITLSCGANPVQVPFYDRLRAGADVTASLEGALTDQTTTVYLCSPNNPDGTVLTAAQQLEVAQFCQRHDLWLISDEAYCDHAFAPHKHRFIANLPGMAERTASIYTASKSYALAGIRIGFLAGDPGWLERARRVSTHQIYNLPLICQRAAKAAIDEGDAWLAEARDKYAAAADHVHRHLEATFHPAQGGGYVFCDVSAELNGKPTLTWLAELLHEGVSIAPGVAFGAHYDQWVRVCYMSLPVPELAVAIERLNRSLNRLRSGGELVYDGPRLELDLGGS
ncbi:MAG: pyridoxal phosphate-dependent aminotransferase [Myxococcales bacterium]|nr:pyridoxal phosphate-dependent aminotransferase [Myxococcales bacterium]